MATKKKKAKSAANVGLKTPRLTPSGDMQVLVEVSPQYSLNKADIWKTVRGLGIIILGALVTYASAAYLDWNYTVHWNGSEINLAPIATAVIGSVLELARRFVSDYSAKK